MKLEEKLLRLGDSDYYPFHMPGHKRQLVPWDVGSPYGADITEIDGFDNLNDAHGIILEEEKQAAAFYGTEETLFSVNGSTACLLSAISAAVSRNGKVLMARNCHKAVYHAVYLRGLETVYLEPPVDEHHICMAVTGEMVAAALEGDCGIEAVVITSPAYEGIVSDVRAIADVAHRYGKPLIVDEAHGAHFGMHPYFPVSAVKQGADLVVQSLHKTLPAMTQTAVLHRCSERVPPHLIHRFMSIYQSSSPSYILMGSITCCLHLLMERGETLFEPYVQMLIDCRKRLGALSHFALLEGENQDPSKLVLIPTGISPSKAWAKENLSMTGTQLYHILLDRYHIQLEMSLWNLALAMTSVGDTGEGFARLCRAMEEIDDADF